MRKHITGHRVIEPTGQHSRLVALQLIPDQPARCQVCSEGEDFRPAMARRYENWNPIDLAACGHLVCLRCLGGVVMTKCPMCA